jgi:hypothetical protein
LFTNSGGDDGGGRAEGIVLCMIDADTGPCQSAVVVDGCCLHVQLALQTSSCCCCADLMPPACCAARCRACMRAASAPSS